MARVDYVVRETASNLFRNITLSLATIITIGVTLTLAGGALIVRKGVENVTYQFRDDTELIVFMQVDAPQGQIDAIERDLDENPQVERSTYVDQQGAYEEFVRLFAQDSPDLVENVTPEVLPTSFKVVPRERTADVVDALKQQFEGKAGVREVVAASDVIRKIERTSNVLNWIMTIAGIVLGGAALVLIVNTIRMAMFARRREIEVMKLVGATNWFIRVPFMCEGLVQGLIGAGLGIGGVYGLNWVMDRFLSRSFDLFQNMVVESGDLLFTSGVLVVAGVLVGMAGSAVAVTRFLDV